MQTGHARAMLVSVGLALAAAIGATIPAAAQTINEFAVPTAGSDPFGITAGPDGALWFTEFVGNKIGRITVNGSSITETAVPTTGSEPAGIVTGPDGALWFTEFGGNKIGRITTSGTVTEFPVPTATSGPVSITVGPDGALWFTELTGDKIGRITTGGAITEFPVPTAGSDPFGIVTGPDGALWFAEFAGNKIGRITTAGAIMEFPVPTATSDPLGIAVGLDGALWFTEFNGNKIGRITTAGAITEFTVPTATSRPYYIAAGPDGALWFAESSGNNIGQVTISGAFKEYPVPTASADPTGIALGPNNAMWFTEGTGNKIGTFQTAVLTIVESGTGKGTVTSNVPVTGGQIDCSATSTACALTYMAGLPITLSGAAASGSTFAGWSGGGCTGTGVCVPTFNVNTTVTATFTQNPSGSLALTVVEAGAGTGQVTSSPSGINCSPTSSQCSANYASGTQVTLTASAMNGSTFAGWSGGGCSGTGTCQVTISTNTSVTASFSATASDMLSVTLAGGGSGTVTSSPSGINCGMTCTASFAAGTQVTLIPSAANGSTFVGWSGGGCSGIFACTLTLSGPSTVTANFVTVGTANVGLLAAVLPDSRSVQVGATATAFATILNTGPGDATDCSVVPVTSIPAAYDFQTTNSATNAVTGTPNTPANIPARTGQSFVFALTPSAAIAPTNVAFAFSCANAATPAPSIPGVNTFVFSASNTPVPDIIALVASSDPGRVDLPGANGTGAFAVATDNLGSSGTITVATNTGTANLPVAFTLCQTDSGGNCVATPTPSVTLTIAAGATPTFGVFAAGNGTVADMPGVNRVFVTFTDAGGVLRGETSLAVRTQ